MKRAPPLQMTTVQKGLSQSPHHNTSFLPKGCSGAHPPLHHRIREGTPPPASAISQMVGIEITSSIRRRVFHMVSARILPR